MAAVDAAICPRRTYSPGRSWGAGGTGPAGPAPHRVLGFLVLSGLGGGAVGGDGSAERCQREHEIQDGQWFHEGFLIGEMNLG